MEEGAREYFARIAALGGAIPALETGFFQREIADAAARYQSEVEAEERVIVGVNRYKEEGPVGIPILDMDPEGYDRQVARLNELRRTRDNEAVSRALAALRAAVAAGRNTMPVLIEAVKAYATLGEVMDVLRETLGVYEEPVII
jgi:methylmalonyl-CoA mutase N-terminal domain/subunit